VFVRRAAMLVMTMGLVVPARAAEPNQACALLTTAELEAALGAKVSPLAGQSIPGKTGVQMGFNTTDSVVKGTTVAAVEITAKARKDLVPIEKVHPLADKIAARVH
jgi:hypothetical protein